MLNLKSLAITATASALLIGCGQIGPATKVPNGCDWTETILVSKNDVLTAGTADQILAHNITRKRLCD